MQIRPSHVNPENKYAYEIRKGPQSIQSTDIEHHKERDGQDLSSVTKEHYFWHLSAWLQ